MSQDELNRAGFRPGADVEYARNPTTTNGVVSGQWVRAKLVEIVNGQQRGRDGLLADLEIPSGNPDVPPKRITVDLKVVRLAA